MPQVRARFLGANLGAADAAGMLIIFVIPSEAKDLLSLAPTMKPVVRLSEAVGLADRAKMRVFVDEKPSLGERFAVNFQ